MKTCPRCKKEKPLSEFWKNKHLKDGFQCWCKKCFGEKSASYLKGKNREKYLRMRKNGNLKRTYGVTIDEYEKMVEKANGVCEICGNKSENRSLSIDHCHDSGKIRGILCDNCNRGIGMFQNSKDLLKKTIEYLKR